jgi:hypothetical protein
MPRGLKMPPELKPTTTMKLALPSGRTVELACCQPQFDRWTGSSLNFTFGGKPVLTYGGQPVFAELLILRLLEVTGWTGTWVSSYGGIKFLREMPKDPSLVRASQRLPETQISLIDKIQRRSNRRGGCFDVFAWRDEKIIFCEAKHSKKDRIRPSQRRWIEAAITEGVPIDSLLIVEWSLAPLNIKEFA